MGPGRLSELLWQNPREDLGWEVVLLSVDRLLVRLLLNYVPYLHVYFLS